MKTSLKQTKHLILLTGVLALTPLAGLADLGTVHPRGTDVLHYGVKKQMVNEAVETNATGRVDIRQNHQGKVTVQMMDITVRKLSVLTAYQVVIPAGPAEPAASPVVVASFTTDRRGNALLRFRDIVHKNGNSTSIGRGKLPLPVSVNPLTGVRKLVVADTNGVPLLTADLSAPTHLTYRIKRDLSTDTIPASLQIVANSTTAYLRLYAARLTSSADYQLLLNGGAPETFTTDASGRLVVRSKLESPLDVLKLHSVELLDAANIVVLGTSLP